MDGFKREDWEVILKALERMSTVKECLGGSFDARQQLRATAGKVAAELARRKVLRVRHELELADVPLEEMADADEIWVGERRVKFRHLGGKAIELTTVKDSVASLDKMDCSKCGRTVPGQIDAIKGFHCLSCGLTFEVWSSPEAVRFAPKVVAGHTNDRRPT